MKEIKTIYHPVSSGMVSDREGKKIACTHMKCSLHYRTGGIVAFTNARYVRGYYVSATPCTLRDGLVLVTAFTGVTTPLLECGRAGKKLEEKARKMFDDTYVSFVNNNFPGNSVDFGKED